MLTTENIGAAKQAAPDAETEDQIAILQPIMDRQGNADDLTLIKGLGPKTIEELAKINITSFTQIAALDAKQIGVLDNLLSLNGRIERDGWTTQAARAVLFTDPPPQAPAPAPVPSAAVTTMLDADPVQAVTERKRAIFDKSRTYGVISGVAGGATHEQGGKFFGTNGMEMFPDEVGLLAPVPPPKTSKAAKAKRKRSPADLDAINLTAWAKGQEKYPSDAVFEAIADRYSVDIESERDALDLLMDEKVVVFDEVGPSFRMRA